MLHINSEKKLLHNVGVGTICFELYVSSQKCTPYGDDIHQKYALFCTLINK